MYHPSTRLLTILELLQARGKMSGTELARRLEVSPRSIRRYVLMLQDMGIPVEGERGRYGQYRLRPGYKLPPLMFSDDEALALTVGLLQIRRMGGLVDAVTTEGALAKLDRVLPDTVRQQVAALQETLVLEGIEGALPSAPLSTRVALLSQGVQAHKRLELSYLGRGGEATKRAFDPYSIVQRGGYWYTIGFCQLRQDIRTFRIDRIASLALTDETFVPPESFDALEFLNHTLATIPATYSAEVLLKTSLNTAQREIAPALATLEPLPEGVLLRCTTDDLEWLARILAALSFPWQVKTPEALKSAIMAHAAKLASQAGTAPPEKPLTETSGAVPGATETG